MPLDVFTSADADSEALAGSTVAVIGYGNLGSSMAANLAANGVAVVVGNRDDEYRGEAAAAGFPVADIGDAVARADIVFCRNLFIYFESATVVRVVRALADAMLAPAYLCVAAAESLLRLSTPFALQTLGGAFVYVRP